MIGMAERPAMEEQPPTTEAAAGEEQAPMEEPESQDTAVSEAP